MGLYAVRPRPTCEQALWQNLKRAQLAPFALKASQKLRNRVMEKTVNLPMGESFPVDKVKADQLHYNNQ